MRATLEPLEDEWAQQEGNSSLREAQLREGRAARHWPLRRCGRVTSEVASRSAGSVLASEEGSAAQQRDGARGRAARRAGSTGGSGCRRRRQAFKSTRCAWGWRSSRWSARPPTSDTARSGEGTQGEVGGLGKNDEPRDVAQSLARRSRTAGARCGEREAGGRESMAVAVAAAQVGVSAVETLEGDGA